MTKANWKNQHNELRFHYCMFWGLWFRFWRVNQVLEFLSWVVWESLWLRLDCCLFRQSLSRLWQKILSREHWWMWRFWFFGGAYFNVWEPFFKQFFNLLLRICIKSTYLYLDFVYKRVSKFFILINLIIFWWDDFIKVN